MSLHIGQLSPDVRQPYLEHIFQKYGRCFVYLKDGYGFAVYYSQTDAARALQALHGKIICGRRITVNWSKHQPRYSQGFKRSSRFPDRRTSRGGRENRPESHGERHGKNTQAIRDECHDKNHLASHDESHNPASAQEKEYDKLAEGVNDAGENIAEEEASLGEVKVDEGVTVDASTIERERWVEAGTGMPGGGDVFDFYEPYHGLDRQKENEDVIKASSWDSHDHGRSSEKWQEHSDKRVDRSQDDKSRSSPNCYTCGASGHIARYCPQEMDVKYKGKGDGLSFKEKLELRQRRFGFPSRRQPEFHVHPMDRKHHVQRDSRMHAHNSEHMRQGPKVTRKRNRSERSHGSPLSSEPSHHSHQDNIRGSHSNRTSSDSRCRSPHSRSRFRGHSPSSSAHSSSKSSQPTEQEGLRSNTNHPIQFPTSSLPQHKSSPTNKQEGKGSALNSEVPISSLNVRTLSNGDGKALVPDKCANKAGYSEDNLDKSSARYNDNVANGVQGQIANFDDTSSMKSNQDVLAKNDRNKSLKLTTNEVISALKHYRMETHEVDSLDQPVEEYFGAARLWPWEIIYYRRLKKGSISTENYAKRLEQNKEFGIVDRYVRSSSGWWEYH